MGAKIDIQNNSAIVTGVEALTGADVAATDLRAGAALVIAGLAAHDTTVICNLEHIFRGYEKMEEKLLKLGASVRVITTAALGETGERRSSRSASSNQ